MSLNLILMSTVVSLNLSAVVSLNLRAVVSLNLRSIKPPIMIMIMKIGYSEIRSDWCLNC